MGYWGQIVDGEKRYDLHKGQSEIMRHTARFKAAIAGTGGGKTVLGALWVVEQILRVVESGRSLRSDPIAGFIVAPTHAIMSRATAPTLVATLIGTQLEGRYVESKNRYYLPDGMGIIHLLSADNPNGLEGGQIDFAWLDEAGQMKLGAWEAIQRRCGLRQSPCFITTTPYAMNWIYHAFYLLMQAGNRDYHVEQWASIANPAYPREEYEARARTMDPRRFAMMYQGQFVKMAGLIYPDIDSRFMRFTVPPGQLIGGMDFGFNDPFAAGAASVDKNDHMWVFYERYKTGCTVDEHAKALPPNVRWWGDSSAKEAIIRMRRLGHSVRPNKVMSLQIGFDLVNARIYAGTISFHEDICKALRAEASEYRYESTDEGAFGADPVEGFEHACDQTRYMIANYDRRKIKLRSAA